MESSEIKEMVREKYSQIALQTKSQNDASCCGVGNCCTVDYAVFSENYNELDGYTPDADLGLGCGLPTEFALIKTGDTVVDLGSGAGNDCFVARAIAGENGKIIGVDFTETMLEMARDNADKLCFNNVEFRFGDIEKLPIAANKADVVVSNCVLNLVPDKQKAFSEMFRILKVGGHFSVSDVVLIGTLPENIKNAAELYAGCVSGAIQKSEYLKLLKEVGFENIKVQKEKAVILPNEILRDYMTEKEINDFRNNGAGIYSVTVYGEKTNCCSPDKECC